MYESFFDLNTRPFLAAPVAESYYPAASIEHARETVSRCIERAEGPAVIIGAAGTGKSTLCHVLAQQFRDTFQVAMLASARLCTRRALLQNILFELKLPYRDREEGELRLSLIDHLEPSDECPHGMLLLVDEAHTLPLRLLEEIRMITNLVRDGQPRVRLVLAAGLMLDERLASPHLESFSQRVAARCYLQSMNRDDTCGYIRAQLATAGGQPDQIFMDDALQAVYQATDGIPRLVNQVCDHVLMMAAIGRQGTIDARGIEEAWADLQQLPAPWGGEPAGASSAENNILEFGSLDDASCGELDSQDPVADQVDGVEDDQVVGDAATKLDEIENGISAIVEMNPPSSDEPAIATGNPGEDGADEQFRPRAVGGPEIELVFHHAHDPFKEQFEQEEVIVDPLASLETLGATTTSHSADEPDQATLPFRDTESAEQQDDSDDIDPAFDPVLPEDAEVPAVASLADARLEAETVPSDDRDLLELMDDPGRSAGHPAAEDRPKRREYRQLFANLRRR